METFINAISIPIMEGTADLMETLDGTTIECAHDWMGEIGAWKPLPLPTVYKPFAPLRPEVLFILD